MITTFADLYMMIKFAQVRHCEHGLTAFSDIVRSKKQETVFRMQRVQQLALFTVSSCRRRLPFCHVTIGFITARLSSKYDARRTISTSKSVSMSITLR